VRIKLPHFLQPHSRMCTRVIDVLFGEQLPRIC
jgi:hypothetical protein